MSNLLPRDAKRTLVFEYRARVIAMWCFVLSTACLVIGLLFLPSFILISSQLKYAENTFLAATGEASERYASTLSEINEANALGRQLSARQDEVSATDVIREVEKELGSDITFNGLTFDRATTEGLLIEMRGVATTRDELARFVERLKANPYFSDASVPFAQLAQATDAAFTATIHVRPKKQQ